MTSAPASRQAPSGSLTFAFACIYAPRCDKADVELRQLSQKTGQ
jgi:hypothetical protein